MDMVVVVVVVIVVVLEMVAKLDPNHQDHEGVFVKVGCHGNQARHRSCIGIDRVMVLIH